MRNQWWLTAALLVACAQSDPTPTKPLRLGAPVAATSCDKPAAACVTLQSLTYTDTAMNRKLMYSCLLWVSSCVTPPPNPNPPHTPIPAAGGATGVGGAVGTGGTTNPRPTPEAAACANLKAVGCPEGAAPDCAESMVLRCSNPKVECATACLTAAADKAAAQKCGLACGRL
jgi:hypothetical protein